MTVATCDSGVRALATYPRKNHKKETGGHAKVVMTAGVSVRSGDWIYADTDGVLVARRTLV